MPPIVMVFEGSEVSFEDNTIVPLEAASGGGGCRGRKMAGDGAWPEGIGFAGQTRAVTAADTGQWLKRQFPPER